MGQRGELVESPIVILPGRIPGGKPSRSLSGGCEEKLMKVFKDSSDRFAAIFNNKCAPIDPNFPLLCLSDLECGEELALSCFPALGDFRRTWIGQIGDCAIGIDHVYEVSVLSPMARPIDLSSIVADTIFQKVLENAKMALERSPSLSDLFHAMRGIVSIQSVRMKKEAAERFPLLAASQFLAVKIVGEGDRSSLLLHANKTQDAERFYVVPIGEHEAVSFAFFGAEEGRFLWFAVFSNRNHFFLAAIRDGRCKDNMIAERGVLFKGMPWVRASKIVNDCNLHFLHRDPLPILLSPWDFFSIIRDVYWWNSFVVLQTTKKLVSKASTGFFRVTHVKSPSSKDSCSW